ncbi:MAG: hypothetical protein ABW164_05520 [Sphingobium sp.]
MIDQPPEASETLWTPLEAERDEGVRATISRFVADGRAYAQAEAERQKLRATIVMGGVRDALIFGVVALLLAVAAVIAFLVGLIITLTPLIGPLGATATVVIVTFAIVAILLVLAKKRIVRMKQDIAQ